MANGGSLDDATKGLDFFKQLNDAGNFVPIIATSATIAAGETPIAIRWTYNALANRDATAASGGPAIEVVVPTSVRFAGVYVQGISAFAPHPNAAKLWEEFLYSDQGQNIWLKGYCHPIRYENLVETNAVPAEQLAKLPDVDGRRVPDARAARYGQDAHHRPVGRRRRSQRPVGPAVVPIHRSSNVVAVATTAGEPGAQRARRARRRFGWAWLGLLPFFIFAIAFMFLPVVYLVVGSFLNSEGAADPRQLRGPVDRHHPGRLRHAASRSASSPRSSAGSSGSCLPRR